MYDNVKLVVLQKVTARVSNGHDGAIPVLTKDGQLVSICYIDKKLGMAYDLLSNDEYFTFIKGEVVRQDNLAELKLGDYVVTDTNNYDVKNSTTRLANDVKRNYKKALLKASLKKLSKYAHKQNVKHL